MSTKNQKLWPDAFDAPDVPSRNTLLQFLEDPRQLDKDLREQIQDSENCQRALLQLEKSQSQLGQLATDHVGEEGMGEIVRAIRKASEKVRTEAKKLQPPAQPTAPLLQWEEPLLAATDIAVGQVWSLRGEALVWTGTRIARWKVKLLQNAIVVGGPIAMPWNDTIVRVVPLQHRDLFPDELWDEGCMTVEDPILKPDLAVVHPAFEFPMSISQLGVFIGTLSAKDAKRLHLARKWLFKGKGIGNLAERPTERVTPEARLANERTLAEVSWFSATADALKCAAEQETLN